MKTYADAVAALRRGCWRFASAAGAAASAQDLSRTRPISHGRVRLRGLPHRSLIRISHSPAGGRYETPFGDLVAPNITPDQETGIGNWTDEQFDDAVRAVLRADGERLYPAMPYRLLHPDVRGRCACHSRLSQNGAGCAQSRQGDRLPFPLSVRAVMRIWDDLYFTPGEFHSDPSRSAEWNRGAYLVTAPDIAPPAIHRRIFSARTSTTCSSRAMPRRDGSAPT